MPKRGTTLGDFLAAPPAPFDGLLSRSAAGGLLGGDFPAPVAAAPINMVPLTGGMVRKGMKALPSSSSLNSPRSPSLDELSKFVRKEPVPLAMARGSQRKMEWEKFNRGEHGVPMFEGFADAPVAIRKKDGEYIILDGHHRTVKAMNDGKKELSMYVIDAEKFDPANAGRPSKPDSIDTDALLRELMGDP